MHNSHLPAGEPGMNTVSGWVGGYVCMVFGIISQTKARSATNEVCSKMYIRGVFKKFAARPRRKTNFTTKRGVRDVTLLKRSLTQPLPNWSCCFAQAVGCCKNVGYFCIT